MSFSCPFDGDVSSASVAFPCEKDLVVNILRDLLGKNYVDAFLISGKSPALATLIEPTVLSMTLSLLASVAITAAILIFVVSIYKWVTESANDGEAVGLSERGGILGMFGRPFFALALLVPTASGYPTINLIIMTVVLWANGATNQLYKTVSEKSMNVLNIDSSFSQSETFIQANDVTDAYVSGAAQGYCIAQLMASGSDIKAQNVVELFIKGSVPLERNPNPTSKTTYSDNKGWFLSKSRDVCGSFDSNVLTVDGIVGKPSQKLGGNNWMFGKETVFGEIKKIQQAQAEPITKLVELRRGYAAYAYIKGMNEALGTTQLNKVFGVGGDAINGRLMSSKMLGTEQSILATKDIGFKKGWDIDMTLAELANPANIKALMADAMVESKALHDTAVRVVKFQITDNGDYIGRVQAASRNIQQALLSTGWMNAGNAQATLRQLKNGGTNKVNYKPYTVNYALGFSTSEVEEDEQKAGVLNNITAMISGLNKGVLENLPKAHPAQVTLASQLLQADSERGADGGNMANSLASTLSAPYHNLNESLISIIVDENSADDTLTRIQSFGEFLLAIIGFTLLAIIAIKVAIMVSKNAAATATGISFGVTKGAEATVTNGADLINDILLSPLGELLDTFLLLSRIFGVVIPSMPYIFLILAGIGWFVQIIQTMFGMPLWLIMHSIPDKSFIGSQQQGYVTLLSMLFRPILIISGFYVAFDLYDPLVIYATRAFFDSYGTISGATSSSSVSEFLIYFGSLKYWYFLYAGVLMSITYLVFGLVQELSDSVLDWLGTNLLRGFGNMDTKSTVQGIANSMSASSKAGRAGIANKMKARNDAAAAAGRGQKPNDPANETEQAAADSAVAGVRAGAAEASNNPTAAAVVSDTERSINNTDAAGDVAVDSNRAAGTLDQLEAGGQGAEIRRTDADEVTGSGSEIATSDTDINAADDVNLNNNAAELQGDEKAAAEAKEQEEAANAQNLLDAVNGDVTTNTDTAANANASTDQDRSINGAGAALAGAALVGASAINAGAKKGGTPQSDSSSSTAATGKAKGAGVPSAKSNAKLAGAAAGGGLLAGKALSTRAGGLAAGIGKGTVTSTDSAGGFAVAGLGEKGDITARGTATDNGYSAQLFQNKNGQEVSIGSEAVQEFSDGSVTTTTQDSTGDISTVTTDANENLVGASQQTTLDNGATQTDTQDYADGTSVIDIRNPDGSTVSQTSDINSGAVMQTQAISADDTVTNTVDFTPTGGANSIATASSTYDSVSGTMQSTTFDPATQSTQSVTTAADGSSMTVTTPNSALDSSGQVVSTPPAASATAITQSSNVSSIGADARSELTRSLATTAAAAAFLNGGAQAAPFRMASGDGINNTASGTGGRGSLAPSAQQRGMASARTVMNTQQSFAATRAAGGNPLAPTAATSAAQALGNSNAVGTAQAPTGVNSATSYQASNGYQSPNLAGGTPTSVAPAPLSPTSVNSTTAATATQAASGYQPQSAQGSNFANAAPAPLSPTLVNSATATTAAAATQTAGGYRAPNLAGSTFANVAPAPLSPTSVNSTTAATATQAASGYQPQSAQGSNFANAAPAPLSPTLVNSATATTAAAATQTAGGYRAQSTPRSIPTPLSSATANVTSAAPTIQAASGYQAPNLAGSNFARVAPVTTNRPNMTTSPVATNRQQPIGSPTRLTPVRQVAAQRQASTAIRTNTATRTSAPTPSRTQQPLARITPLAANTVPDPAATYSAVVSSSSNVIDSGSRVRASSQQLEGFPDIDEDQSITTTRPAAPPTDEDPNK